MRAAVETNPTQSYEGSKLEHIILNTIEQRSFVENHGTECFSGETSDDNIVLEKYDEIIKGGLPHMAHELWKYCALSLPPSSFINGNADVSLAYLDSESPLLNTFADAFLEPTEKRRNYAVLGSNRYFPKTMHGSFLSLSPSNAATVARKILKLIVETDLTVLGTSALLIPSALYSLVKYELVGTEIEDEEESGGGSSLKPGVYSAKNGEEWVLLEQNCHNNPFLDVSISEGNRRSTHSCPSQIGHCCDVSDPTSSSVVFLTKHPLLPYQLLPPQSLLPRPYAIDRSNEVNTLYQTEVFDEDYLPFIATMREKVLVRPEGHIATPNLYDKFHANNCLPSSPKCTDCLRDWRGATCHTCKAECGCYCKNLCKTNIEKKHVSKIFYVTPPTYSRDSSRLVPKIVHQVSTSHCVGRNLFHFAFCNGDCLF